MFRLLPEANVTSLAQINKIPIKTAQSLNDFDRKNAAVHANIFVVFAQNVFGSGTPESGAHDEYDPEVIRQYVGSTGKRLKAVLDRQPKKAQELMALASEDFDEFEMSLEDLANPVDIDKLKARAEIKFPDGFFWVKLNSEEYRREGNDMQHCGIASSGGDMYSLRDPQGKPHVTVEIDEKNTGLSNEPVINQIKGKQNEFPDKKYWSYVKQFIQKFGASNSETLTPFEFRYGP